VVELRLHIIPYPEFFKFSPAKKTAADPLNKLFTHFSPRLFWVIPPVLLYPFHLKAILGNSAGLKFGELTMIF